MNPSHLFWIVPLTLSVGGMLGFMAGFILAAWALVAAEAKVIE